MQFPYADSKDWSEGADAQADLRLCRARDKGSIRVKYPYILSKYSITFKNLGIDTQLIWQNIQLFPNWRVKIKVSSS